MPRRPKNSGKRRNGLKKGPTQEKGPARGRKNTKAKQKKISEKTPAASRLCRPRHGRSCLKIAPKTRWGINRPSIVVGKQTNASTWCEIGEYPLALGGTGAQRSVKGEAGRKKVAEWGGGFKPRKSLKNGSRTFGGLKKRQGVRERYP